MSHKNLTTEHMKILAGVGAAREIEEGHGMTDVSCRHGSRWIWWYPEPDKGQWENVVLASICDCGDPPAPFKKETTPQ